MLRRHKIIIGLIGAVGALASSAYASDKPAPCFYEYCFTKDIDEFRASIPINVDYYERDSGINRHIKINAPVLIHGQSFELDYLTSSFKEPTYVLSAIYEFTPRSEGECLSRYKALLDYLKQKGFETKPQKRKAKVVEYFSDLGVRFTMRAIPIANSQLSSNENVDRSLEYNLKVSLYRANISHLESCKQQVQFYITDKKPSKSKQAR